jgi:hypothetical protein
MTMEVLEAYNLEIQELELSEWKQRAVKIIFLK